MDEFVIRAKDHGQRMDFVERDDRERPSRVESSVLEDEEPERDCKALPKMPGKPLDNILADYRPVSVRESGLKTGS
jgi:hypothetical protein